MNSLRVLDVTLRDGGCVNDFNFGQSNMEQILSASEEANVDIIELGYIDDKRGSLSGRTQYVNEQVVIGTLLHKKRPDTTYVVMMDYGKFNVDNLQPAKPEGVDGIRLAFHKKDCRNIVSVGKKIIEKGYQLFLQPMITLRYSDRELLELIDVINNELVGAVAFYIVDSFGELRPNDMNRVLNLVDHNLNESMALGFHSHNNLQLSYSNAIAMLQFPTNRDMIIDSSIMGMGKGAGNLNTELLLEHLNLYYGKKYNIRPLLEVIDKVINQLRAENYWGYAVEFYLSAINHCSPSYASHYFGKHMLPIEQVSELLGLIDEEKKISFDKEYAETLYRQYNEATTIDDGESFTKLAEIIGHHKVLILGPGKSICANERLIDSSIETGDYITIGLNAAIREKLDFVLISRKNAYERIVNTGQPMIVTSNACSDAGSGRYVLNYKNWIAVGEANYDSALTVALRLMEKCQAEQILLAGCDGYSVGVNDNYYESTMRIPITEVQAEEKNQYNKELIQGYINKGLDIVFLTPSRYE